MPVANDAPQLPLGLVPYQAGRFTVAAAPHDETLARALLRAAAARDSFPWLPRPTERILVLIAPDRRAFRDLIGPLAPEYGSAIAVPAERRIIMQGSRAGADAGNPIQVLRHELAHLALHEHLGDLPPRWFDEGYASLAAGEWGREEVLTTNLALVMRGVPSLEALEAAFAGGAARAGAAYALAHRAVVELAALDPARGLTLFFDYWRQEGAFDPAVRRAFNVTEAAFEQRWRDRTRRRYGALALFADLTLAAVVLLFLALPLYLSRRRRDRRRLEAMVRAEEEHERRERESAIDALLRSVASRESSGESPSSPPPGS
ncbi:MAG TPA: hypothetical protein VLE53_16765 [Gemmatimonadaceae bacterium]|nr:hypothetical protein [Gemmatimonadaceae bacterium]